MILIIYFIVLLCVKKLFYCSKCLLFLQNSFLPHQLQSKLFCCNRIMENSFLAKFISNFVKNKLFILGSQLFCKLTDKTKFLKVFIIYSISIQVASFLNFLSIEIWQKKRVLELIASYYICFLSIKLCHLNLLY